MREWCENTRAKKASPQFNVKDDLLLDLDDFEQPRRVPRGTIIRCLKPSVSDKIYFHLSLDAWIGIRLDLVLAPTKENVAGIVDEVIS